MTLSNPYYYQGSLDPKKHKKVLIPRTEQLKKVIKGIRNGDFWLILAPHETGKTTILQQIKEIMTRDAYPILLNLQITEKDEKSFYQRLKEEILNMVQYSDNKKVIESKRAEDPVLDFQDFLMNFEPLDDKRVVFLFDEIAEIPAISKFFNLWRQVYEERKSKRGLLRYGVVIAGSFDPVSINTSLNSPYTIAKNFFIKDFTREEAIKLIDQPLKQRKIKITDTAREILLTEIAGHPKMLQQTLNFLVEDIIETKQKEINDETVNRVIMRILSESSVILTLENDLIRYPDLQGLVKEICEGNNNKEYLPFKHYSIIGAGCIVEGKNQECRIRNKVYERVIRERLGLTNEHSKKNINTPVLKGDGFGGDGTDRVRYPAYLEEDQFNRYTMIENIGKGGMGSRVVKAADKKMQRLIALKLIRSSWFDRLEDIESFFKEAQTAGRLSHPNIVTVYDCGRIADDFFISMEFIEGIVLDSLISKDYPFTFLEILYLAKQILNGLEYAHRHFVIHRDIKPRNIMVANDGKVKIVDFGIAALRVLGKTGDTGIQKGTPAYMAPEQFFAEKTDQRTDIYSFGVTLFEIACSHLPYRGASKDSMARGHIGDGIPVISQYRTGLPADLEKVIYKCMAKEPNDRYQDVREILEAIEQMNLNQVDERSMQMAFRERLPITVVKSPGVKK